MALELEKMHNRAKVERVEDGTYPARVCTIVDLGIQEQTDWKTQEPTEPKPRLLMTFEMPGELIEVEQGDGTVDQMPRLISKEYTQSNFERSNLMKLVTALKPKLKTLTELLDEPCLITVGSTVNANAKVTSVVKAPKGMPVPELNKAASYFDFEAPDEEQFLDLAPWIRIKIKSAVNYNGFADDWGNDEVDA